MKGNITISLELDVMQKLDNLCKKENISASKIISTVLEDYLNKKEVKK